MYQPALAQLNTPAPSPFSTIEQMIGLTNVTVAYSRPGMKGREIMGELVPYGKLWRTGANRATKISFDDPMSIGGQRLEAGEYALFSIPGKNEWTIIISSKGEQNGIAEYKEEEDAARFTVKPQKTRETYETFTIMFSDIDNHSAMMNIMWENTKVQIPVEDYDLDEVVMAQIKQTMPQAGDNDNMYYAAASYYFNNKKDMQQAAEWIDRAAEINDQKYWVLHLQAKIHAALNNADKAKDAAQKSMQLAEKAGNPDYVKLNRELISSLD
jgi:tetratricopeptide (TPR) repeat protein